MAITIPAAFQKFKENLEISGLQKESVAVRQKNVRAAIESELEVLDTFLTGSYSRSTMIGPLKESDVDIFVVLSAKYFHRYNNRQNGGQAGLLDLVKRILRRTYTKTPDISRNGQAVTTVFTDFVVDVVPGFYRRGGGFLIPNSVTQSWISTDPKKHVNIISAANIAHNGDLIPLIKMIKAWNKNIGQHFMSFHLEVLALQILQGVKISNFSSGARYFFGKGKDLISKKNLDPAGYGGDVGKYLNTSEKIAEAVRKFETAHVKALKAEELAARGRIQEATDFWRRIFGDYFPTYG